MHFTPIKRLWLGLLPLLAVYLSACEGSSQGGSNLPQARGASGEIILVIDSVAWRGELGEELRLTFMEPMPGLPQSEPYFDLRRVDPFKLNSVLRSAKNMMFVTTLDNQSAAGRKMQSYFTEESVKRIRQEPDLYMFTKEDEYAAGQDVLHLFGTTEEELIKHLQEDRSQIRQRFASIMLDRITKKIYQANEQRSVSQYLMEEHGFSIRVPYGYDRVPLSDAVEDFVWLRQLEDRDKNVVITYKDYTSEDAFAPENILEFRQQQLGRYIADDPSAYMTIQRIVSAGIDTTTLVEFDTVAFQGKFAVEARGLWKLSNDSMGGGFLSYTFVDESQGRLYYIEGYLYSPGDKKRPSIRELEAILHTFRTPEGEKPVAKQ